MNGITGRIAVVASFLGRLSLLLVVLCGGASANARVVTAPHVAFTIAPATFTAAGPNRGAVRFRHAVGDARTLSGTSAQALSHDLLADRLDEVALLSSLAFDTTLFTEARLAPAPVPFETRPAAARANDGLPLPEPDGWAAVAATIALALFFFLRRLS